MLGAAVSRRQLLVAAGVGGPLAALLAACGGGSGSSGNTAGKTVTIAETTFYSEKFDPLILTGFNKIAACMFECPLRVDEEGQVVPGIVEEWEVAADGVSWTMRMRDDVVFHDGTKCTAEDLAFAYERSITEGMDTASQWEAILGKEPKIDVVDETTFVVHTVQPSPGFIPFSTQLLGIWIVPKAYIEEKGVDYFSDNPIGTGPYQFENLVSGTEMNFKAVEYDHWRVNPEFDSVRIRLIPNASTAVAELRAGGVDVIGVTPQQADELEQANYTLVDVETSQVYMPIVGAYHPSLQGQAIADVRVRQALSLAINRQEIIDTICKGNGRIPDPVRLGLNMPDVSESLRDKWRAWSEENFRYDPDEAKRLLAEAGFADGFTFDLWPREDPNFAYLPDIAQAVAAYWLEIGIQTNLQIITSDVWGSVANPATTDRAVGKMLMGSTSLSKASAAENIAAIFMASQPFNMLYASPDEARYQETVDAIMKEVDEAKYEALLDQLIELSSDSWTAPPLLEIPGIRAFSPRVEPELPNLALGLGDSYAYWKATGA